jgi:hypothetical protein
LEAFDLVVAWAGGSRLEDMGEYRQVLLESPPFAAALAHIGKLVRTRGEFAGSYAHWEREFVNMVLGYDLAYPLEIGTHLGAALDSGVRVEAIDALRRGREEELTDAEAQLASYIRQVVAGQVTDASYKAIETRLGVRGAVEYTTFIAYLYMVMRLFQAFDIAGPGESEVATMLEDFRTGTKPLPDHRATQYRDAIDLWALRRSPAGPREVSVPYEP